MATNIDYAYFGKELVIKNTGAKVFFPCEIYTVLIFRDILIVLVIPPTNVIYDKGLFGVNINGDIIWQIENVNSVHNHPFVDICLKNEILVAGNFDGTTYYVDPITGKILYKEQGR